MRLKTLLPIAAAAASISLTVAAKPASAFSFNNIPNGDTAGDALSGNFQLNVTDNSSNVNNTVLFRIVNNVASSSTAFIKSVHFASSGLLSGITLNNSFNTGVVSFGVSNSLNFPQRTNVPGGFVQDFAADRNTGRTLSNNAGGVQSGEALGVLFTGNYNSVIAALANGTLKVGIHVQGLPNGGSDSFVTGGNPNAVPEPFTIVGSSVALGVGALIRKKQMKKKSIG